MTKVDLVGHKYGKLTVIALSDSKKSGQLLWLCKCDCGTEKIIRGSALRSGNTKSCGCLLQKHNKKQKDEIINHIGERFGRLIITSKALGHRKLWNVKCDCGVEKVVSYSNLVMGAVASCGCLKKERNFNIEKNPLQRKRKSYSIKKYGISLEYLEIIIKSQDNKCALCKNTFLGDKDICVDHDHTCCPLGGSCGKCIRGLLCHKCNLALGNFNDDVDLLKCAINYLQEVKPVIETM